MKRVHSWLFNVKYMQGYVKSTQSSQTVGYVCESKQLGKKLHVYQYITYEDSFSWSWQHHINQASLFCAFAFGGNYLNEEYCDMYISRKKLCFATLQIFSGTNTNIWCLKKVTNVKWDNNNSFNCNNILQY